MQEMRDSAVVALGLQPVETGASTSSISREQAVPTSSRCGFPSKLITP
jgi:hypothetical protein